MPSVASIIQYSPIAVYLAANDIEKGTFKSKQSLDKNLATKIYFVYYFINEVYQQDNNYAGIVGAANYLWELCGIYGLMAESITGNGGIIPVVSGSSSTTIWLLRIYSNNFTGATDYNNSQIVGRNIEIYDNNNQKMLNREGDPIDWGYTPTGITFYNIDATQNSYDYTLFIKGGAVTPTSPAANDPLIITINNENTKTINWTADLQNRFGVFPDLELVLYDSDLGRYQVSSIQPSFDAAPPNMTTITYNGLGSTSQGFIVVK